jgi:hypothetical protein
MIVTVGKRYLSRAEAAEFLSERGYKTAPATLAKRAVVGGGPPFVSWGRKPLYDPEALLQWAQRRCTEPRRSTSDCGEEQHGDRLGDSRRTLMEWQRAAGATTRTAGSQSPAPRPIDGRRGETESANSGDLERPIEEFPAGISAGHQKTDHPCPHPPWQEEAPPSIPVATARATKTPNFQVRVKAVCDRVMGSAGTSADDGTMAQGAGHASHADKKSAADCAEFKPRGNDD